MKSGFSDLPLSINHSNLAFAALSPTAITASGNMRLTKEPDNAQDEIGPEPEIVRTDIGINVIRHQEAGEEKPGDNVYNIRERISRIASRDECGEKQGKTGKKQPQKQDP
jgi:hypothetical protein